MKERLDDIEPLVVVVVGFPESLRQLPGRHRRRAEIVHAAVFDKASERGEGLLDRRIFVPAVDIVKIEVICPQVVKCVVDLTADMGARKPRAVGAGLVVLKVHF